MTLVPSSGLKACAALGFFLVPTLVAVCLLAFTGGMVGSIDGLPDPGEVTRWGLPAARALRDTGATVFIGALVVAAALLPGDSANPALLSQAQGRLRAVASAFGVLWILAAVSELVLFYSDISAAPASSIPLTEIWFFVTEVEYGRILLASVVLAAVAVVAATTAMSATGLGVGAVLAIAALWPLALTGHASGDSSHELGVNLQFMHLLPVTVWVGGLVGIALAGSSARTAVVVGRFSRLAGWCFGLLALSGLLSAGVRLPGPGGLLSTYGALLAIKVVALVLCGVAGWWHRRSLIDAAVPVAGRRLVRLFAVEIAVMFAAVGTGVALSRTAPPAGPVTPPPSPAEVILGRPMPPPLDATQWLTGWRLDTFWGPLALAALAAYLVGVWRLARRGDRWSLGRTTCWIVGCLLLFWATSGPPGTYGAVLFSMHMLQHMTIATAVPLLLVLGAPVTLALRSLHRRTDSSLGAREWLLIVVRSWPMRLVSHPIVAASLFVGGLVAFYYSGLFEASLRTHTGHLLMTAHFLISGYLFANVICGIDPGPRRPPYPFRVVLVMVTFAFHAFFSVGLMSSKTVLAEDWYGGLGRTWGRSLIDDQYLGASLGWAMGDLPLTVLAFALVVAWFRDDRREARRLDRQADRDGDARLTEYNAYLRTLAARPVNNNSTAEEGVPTPSEPDV